MALPSDQTDSFIREVDENLRRDQAADLAKRYGRLVAVAVAVFLVAAAGLIYWRSHQRSVSEEQGEKLAATLRQIGDGQMKDAPARLDDIADKSSGALEASARMTRAALAIQQNDRPGAISRLHEIADDKGMPQPYRDLATIRVTALEFDTLKPDEIIARLAPLADKDNAWFGSAGEMTALAKLRKNDLAGARAMARAVADQPAVPASLKARMNDLATTLDVSPAPAAPAVKN